MQAHRINAYEAARAAMKPLVAVETYLHQTTLGPRLIGALIVIARRPRRRGKSHSAEVQDGESS